MATEDELLEKSLRGKWQYPQDLKKWDEHIKGYSIDGCAALNESNLVFIFRREEGTGPVIKLIRFFRDEKKQFSGKTIDNVKEIGYIVGLNEENALWVTNRGDVYNLAKTNESSGFEKPIPGKDDEFGYKVVGGIGKVGNHVYAACGWRHVFKRTAKDTWVDITTKLDRSDIFNKKGAGWNINKSSRTGFVCIGGSAENDLYAAGDGGDCWHYDGMNWKRIDLPTNETVNCIVAISQKQVYMACGGGVLLMGGQDNWKVIKHPDNKDNFEALVAFQGVIYVSTGIYMYKVVDGKLEEHIPAKENYEIEPFTQHYLSANNDIMLSCGQVSVAIFDGYRWFPFAPNGPSR